MTPPERGGSNAPGCLAAALLIHYSSSAHRPNVRLVLIPIPNPGAKLAKGLLTKVSLEHAQARNVRLEPDAITAF